MVLTSSMGSSLGELASYTNTTDGWIESSNSGLVWNSSVNTGSTKESFWKRLFKKKSKIYKVDEFFLLIKRGLQEMNYKKALKYKKEIIKQIKQCNELGQTSMINRMNQQLNGIKKEIQVIAKLGLTKYVFEHDIADLESTGIEGRTVYRKNLDQYESVIPEKSKKLILKAKNSKLFDQIVIIFTRKLERVKELDQKKKTSSPQRKQVDPICFGYINETNRLFIISDRIDDECDFDIKKLQKIVDIKTL